MDNVRGMLKSSVIDYFKTQAEIARALGIGRAAVSRWGDVVPPLQASRLAQITNGALHYDAESYRDWYQRNRQKTSRAA